MNIRNVFLGKPVKTKNTADLFDAEILNILTMPVFISNSISTVAYASEQIFIALAVTGISMWNFSNIAAVFISLSIVLIGFLYMSIITAYPKNTTCYDIANDNIKQSFFALLSSSAMLFDYIMTLAVSVSAAVAAIYSMKENLLGQAPLIAVLLIFILMYVNLRGNKLNGFILNFPVYIFIVGIFAIIMIAIMRNLSGDIILYNRSAATESVKVLYGDLNVSFNTFKALSVVLFLKAFSNGFVSLTGIENIVCEVEYFKKPSASNAIKTLLFTIIFLVIMFLGIKWAASYFHIIPKSDETLLSQISKNIFGHGYIWYIFQFSTVLVLMLAANSCFVNFPKLIAVMAKNKYAPRQFKNLGDTLSYSNGVVILALFAIIITFIFKASLYRLIPLYAIGVFITLGITLYSVALRMKSQKNILTSVVLFVGSFVVSLIASVIIFSKFGQGAFLTVLIIGTSILIFYKIHNHYIDLANCLRLNFDEYVEPVTAKTTAIILTSGIHKGIVQAISYSKSISNDARALYINTDAGEAEYLKDNWEKYSQGIPLVILDSPYRNIVKPILQYLEEAKRERPGYIINIIIPEIVFKKTWHKLLHNKLAFVLRVLLSFQKDVIITHVSYYINE